jgi:hypothetical protein
MVGGVVGVRGGALVGFAICMSAGTCGPGGCWCFLSGGALVWHGCNTGFVVLLLSVGVKWTQDVVRGLLRAL